MKLWNLIKRFGGHSPKKKNIHFEQSPHGNGMTYDEAKQEAKWGYKVRKTDWPPKQFVIGDDEGRLSITYNDGASFYPYIPATADQYGGCNWVKLERTEKCIE